MAATVTCIVLNWNSRPHLESCLSSLLDSDYQEAQYVVVDNASIDGSVEFINQRFPMVEVIRNETNLGFAGGNNVALEELEGDFAVLVNPDVTVTKDWLANLIMPLSSDNQIGIAGCKTYYPGGKRLQHAGGYIEYPLAFPGHRGIDEEDEGQYDEMTDVEYVTGAVFVIRREVLDDIGLFDEGYFLYYEEVDLCNRARKAGYRVVINPVASAVHMESAVTQKGSRFYHNQMHRSRWRYLIKHYPIVTILEDTVPAESKWLRQVEPDIRSALLYAYRHTLTDLPSILTRREKETGEAIPESQVEDLARALESMRRQYRPIRQDLVTLSDLAHIEERPFRSGLPFIGSSVAALRDLWSRVAVRPFVRPILRQQNDINQLNVERLSDSVNRIENRDRAPIERDRLTADLERQLRQVSASVSRLENRLVNLELEPEDPNDDEAPS